MVTEVEVFGGRGVREEGARGLYKINCPGSLNVYSAYVENRIIKIVRWRGVGEGGKGGKKTHRG